MNLEGPSNGRTKEEFEANMRKEAVITINKAIQDLQTLIPVLEKTTVAGAEFIKINVGILELKEELKRNGASV